METVNTMAWYHKLNHPKNYALGFLKWIVLSLVLGGIGGLVGTAFHYVLDWATEFRTAHSVIIWFLPLAGLPIVGLYQLCRMEKSHGTNDIIDAFHEKAHVSPFLAPLIFVATAITHLFGGSAGREGAALQIGGTLGSLFGRALRLSKDDHRILVLSGMSAVFAALFGTPMTACLFSLEFISLGTVFGHGLLPCFIASFTASRVALAFQVPPTVFPTSYVLPLDVPNVLLIAVLGICIALLSILFCHAMHETEHLLKKLLPNAYIRIVVGGAVITALTMLLGTNDYNGAGMDVVTRALAGETVPWAFLLKILFTAITLGAGYKGGEIVPTFFIGATFGCLAAQILGIDPGFGAALGMIGLFCCVTNSPITSLILSVEMFGGSNLLAFAIICVIGLVLSSTSGLYASQTRTFPQVFPGITDQRSE